MKKPTFKIVKEELMEVNGEVVSKKTISEIESPKKYFLGINVESFDLYLKLVGIVTIIISCCTYLDGVSKRHQDDFKQNQAQLVEQTRYDAEQQNNLKKQEAEKKRQYVNDTTSEARYRQSEIDFKTNLANQNRLLGRQLNNNLELFRLQQLAEIQKEGRQDVRNILTNVSVQMEKLIKLEPNSGEYINAEVILFGDLESQLHNIINDPILLNVFVEFEKYFSVYKVISDIPNHNKSINASCKEIQKQISINERLFILPFKDTTNLILSFLYKKGNEISRQAAGLNLIYLQLDSLADTETNRKIKDSITLIKKMFETVLKYPNGYDDYSTNIFLLTSVLDGTYGWNSTTSKESLKSVILTLKDDFFIANLNTNIESPYNDANEILLKKLEGIKLKFDSTVQIKMDLLSQIPINTRQRKYLH